MIAWTHCHEPDHNAVAAFRSLQDLGIIAFGGQQRVEEREAFAFA